MKGKWTILGLLLILSALVTSGCGTVSSNAAPPDDEPIVTNLDETDSETSGEAEGSTEEQPAVVTGMLIAGWMGSVSSTPEGAQFDDYLILQPEGAGEVGIEGAAAEIQAEIVALRDQQEPGKYAHFWGTLICDIIDYGSCQLLVTHVRSGATMSGPDPIEGIEGTLVSNPAGSQFDDVLILAGNFGVGYGVASLDPALQSQLEGLRDTGAVIRLAGSLRTGVPDACGSQIEVTQLEVVWQPPTSEPVPEPVETWEEPVEGWWGEVVGYPFGSQFDDYFQHQIFDGQQYGIESRDPDIQAQLVNLRSSGTTVQVWGTLTHNVIDVNNSQILVTRIEIPERPEPPEITEEPVEGWVGTIGRFPWGSQLGSYFERDDGERFGIHAMDEALRQLIDQYQWTGAQVQVWGTLITGIPDVEGRQIQVARIEAVSGPEQEGRNLALFADMSASSTLPSDRGGTYHAWSAIDGQLASPWVEGVSGSGVGEWVMLTFPGTVEVWGIGLDVGYDRNDDLFYANSRIKKATFVFSGGDQITLDFADTRGMQMQAVARAPQPIQTTSIKVIIEAVYPGSDYDDTCLGEIEVLGMTR